MNKFEAAKRNIELELQQLLKQYDHILNFTNLEHATGITQSMLSQHKTGRRKLSVNDSLALCAYLQKLMTSIHQCLNNISDNFKTLE